MSSDRIARQVARRRTFGIISHPDAGKTTMTEKLLQLGGAIQMAGTVKARKAGKYATSDWMELEKQRGISVTTSVMRFPYGEHEVNLLDTPGHNDFSEDTYRTLTAVDSALMMIDSAKGVEAQTVKLMDVCRMRDTPIVTFINKLDREGLDPFELLDNVEDVLGIACAPMTWPIGSGRGFRGVYEFASERVHLFDPTAEGGYGGLIEVQGLADPELERRIGPLAAGKLREEVELVTGAGTVFEQESFLRGQQTPVYFGSALTGFGVEQLLQGFLAITPEPLPRQAVERLVEPREAAFSGFVFKIQANMDPNHRDRIAFLRICSGRFERGQKVRHVRLGRDLKISNPIIFMAQEREILEEAWPGDIVGLHDTGLLEIGDTLTAGEQLHFTGIPSFAPEMFRRVRLENPLRMKNLRKGLEQLAQEGAVQLFKPLDSPDYIVGVVGALQLDVLKARLDSEYGVRGIFDGIELATARWYRCEDSRLLERFERDMSRNIARDVRGRPVFLAESSWRLGYTQEKYPDVQFFATSDGAGAG
ncbi:MAG: peptide chain release factor 3 [Deltaproteobacteria bacterium]|nr:MAG: peptide chain release factor 3 [Deltaproteobacteria bacterium]